MNRETKQELNRLSKEVFGVSSKWQKIVNQGVAEPYEKDRIVMVPDGRGGVKEKKFTDKKYVLRHYTADEVTKIMLDIIAARSGQAIPVATSATPSVQSIPDGATVTLSDGSTATVTSQSAPADLFPENVVIDDFAKSE